MISSGTLVKLLNNLFSGVQINISWVFLYLTLSYKSFFFIYCSYCFLFIQLYRYAWLESSLSGTTTSQNTPFFTASLWVKLEDKLDCSLSTTCPHITEKNFSRSWIKISFCFSVAMNYMDYFISFRENNTFLQFMYMKGMTKSQSWASRQYLKTGIRNAR